MKYFFLSLGSNINPFENVQQMLKGLLEISPCIDISRIVRTEAVGFSSNSFFLNMAVRVATSQSATDLKMQLNELESRLGRNRNDPNKKLKDRTADLDILFSLEKHETFVAKSLLPKEDYVLPTLLDLLNYLELDHEGVAMELEGLVDLHIDYTLIGMQPLTLEYHETLGVTAKVSDVFAM